MSEPRKLAVALRYEAPDAPTVVAVGRGWLGEQIIEAAREAGVPLEANPALAEALSHIELDAEIPEALYVAVAEIIAFVLRAGEGLGERNPPPQGEGDHGVVEGVPTLQAGRA